MVDFSLSLKRQPPSQLRRACLGLGLDLDSNQYDFKSLQLKVIFHSQKFITLILVDDFADHYDSYHCTDCVNKMLKMGMIMMIMTVTLFVMSMVILMVLSLCRVVVMMMMGR